MQPFYGSVFLPTMKKLVDTRLTYDQVKNILEIRRPSRQDHRQTV